MPCGRTHDRITLWSLPPLVGLVFSLTHHAEITLLVSGGFLFSGLMFGPDLDIYSRQFQRWGILRWIWLPYQKCLRHRSFLSHGLVIGTVIRVIYLGVFSLLMGMLCVAIAQLIFGFEWNWHTAFYNFLKHLKDNYPEHTIALWIGLELGAMSHSLSDWLTSAYKKYLKKSGKKDKIPSQTPIKSQGKMSRKNTNKSK